MPPCPRRPRHLASPPPVLLPLLVAAVLGAQPRLVSAEGAPASPEENRRAAKARLDRGAALVEKDDLRGALAEFEAAYRLVPSPNIFHNFGIVYEGLGRKAEALTAFQRFLAEAPTPAADVRQHAERAVAELSRQVAALTVEADVPGAEILIDGERRGSTPHQGPFYLDPGTHQVAVEEPASGIVHQEQVKAEPGAAVTVRAALRSRLLEQMPSERLARSSASPLAIEAPAAKPPARRWQRPAAWASAGAALLALGLGLQQGLAYNSSMDEFNDVPCYEEEEPDYGGVAKCRSLYQEARDARSRALWSGIVGGALGVTAAVLFLTLPEPAVRPTGELSIVCAPAAAGLGLGCRARF